MSKLTNKFMLNLVLLASMALTAAFLLAPESAAQQGKAVPKGPIKGTVQQIQVHGAALEGNLEGDSPDRDVFVYLPESYASSPNRRYPVVYFLHGYGIGAEQYWNIMSVPEAATRVMDGEVQEMILVHPDANTVYNGAMYSSSPVTGDWETYISRDLVEYIDSNYRTIADRSSRGLAGHSMGGYGTLRIGMKHPEVFGALYAMSSCCLMNNPQRPSPEQLAAQQAEADAQGNAKGKAKGKGKGGFALVGQAQGAAWSPNPQAPPDFMDLPVENGQFNELAAARYVANSPLVMVDQYVPALKSMAAIAMDVGLQDNLSTSNMQLDTQLNRLQVPHSFETYQGDHNNRVQERFASKVLPFFSEYLVFE